MNLSRSKKAALNTICELLLELITIICSFILPRLILSHFGSTYNGITTSISQFIGVISLLKSGIGSVTRAALYKPLATNDSIGVSRVVNATSGFMKKVALIFIVFILTFACIYPFIVSEDFGWVFSFSLVLILSLSTFAQYFFGLTYQMVLQADQKNYIISLVTIASTLLNTIISSVLILMGLGIHAVKLGSAIVFVIPPLFYNIWVRKKYSIKSDVKPDFSLISQRWDAFGQQIASFVHSNTDIILVTIFRGVSEVSVYSVYNLVASGLRKGINAICVGVTGGFGNLIAKNESELLRKRYNEYSFLMYALSTITLSIASILYIPFVALYTKGINDVNYLRPLFGYLMCCAQFFACVKFPPQMIFMAAGHFKQTRKWAINEAIINLVISLGLVNFMGLNGIMIGTIVSEIYVLIKFNNYVCDNLIKQSRTIVLKNLIYSILIFMIMFELTRFVPLSDISTWYNWLIWAFAISGATIIVAGLISLVLFKKEMFGLIQLLKRMIKR